MTHHPKYRQARTNTVHVRSRFELRLRPLAATILGGIFFLSLMWSAAITSYVVFHDDVIAEILSRHSSAQRSYEERIAGLRDEVERITSRHMVERATFTARINSMVQRQAILEQRQVTIAALAGAEVDRSRDDAITTGSAAPRTPASTGRPMPVGDAVRLAPRAALPERVSRTLPRVSTAEVPITTALPHAEDITTLTQAFDRIEAQQSHVLTALEEKIQGERASLATIYDTLNLDMRRRLASLDMPDTETGGPLMELPTGSEETAFERQARRILEERTQVERLAYDLESVPLDKPVERVHRTSRFGSRLDPFLRRPAFHSGVDFRAPTGTPIFSTARGRVIAAGRNGGYGISVDVDHGHGLVTRYAHLSQVSVKVGEEVAAGDRVGLSGNTGRSRGPHLHYETRINNSAVDPDRFLRAGRQFGVY